jgi:SHS2 domain-containing protein
MYEVFEHTADIGLRVHAADLPGLFTGAADALFSLISPGAASDGEPRHFAVAGDDPELLLFDWLNDLLFTSSTDDVVLTDIELRVDSEGIDAVAVARPVEAADVLREVKAITYHGLSVRRDGNEWLAEFIVDV